MVPVTCVHGPSVDQLLGGAVHCLTGRFVSVTVARWLVPVTAGRAHCYQRVAMLAQLSTQLLTQSARVPALRRRHPHTSFGYDCLTVKRNFIIYMILILGC